LQTLNLFEARQPQIPFSEVENSPILEKNSPFCITQITASLKESNAHTLNWLDRKTQTSPVQWRSPGVARSVLLRAGRSGTWYNATATLGWS